ncbi:hypothetical protein FGB62_11g08 [Gracilaria domingensis]|nr:hypothetical protein FGB62_11g08 [Gracilaria domingensis]
MPLVGLDIARYKPARPFSHYGEVDVNDTGSVRSVKTLSDDVVKYLEQWGVNSSLWDGSKGIFGRDYVSNKAPVSSLKERERQRLYQQYIDLRKDLPSHEILERLNNNLEIQTRTQRQIITSIYEIEKELEQLRKTQERYELEGYGTSQRLLELTQQIKRLESDCALSKTAAEKITKKVKQSRIEISEKETGYVRRIALLRCLVNSMSKDERPNGRSKADMNEFRRLAREADEKSGRTCLDFLQIKRVYIDAKTGVLHLYNLESILKGVLEHLEVSMRHSSATLIDSNSHVTNAHTGYIRRQWALAKSNFSAALPFVKNTSLIRARGMVEEQVLNREANRSDSGVRTTAVFDEHPRLLPSYTRIRLRHFFNRRSRIVKLHRNAARAYKEINVLYDCHERTVKEAWEVLQEKEVENRRAHDELIISWENLLGVQSD